MPDLDLEPNNQPIRIIISKPKTVSTQNLVDWAAECYGRINSLPDGTFSVLFEQVSGTITFERYSLFVNIIKNFGCDIKNNEF